MKIKLLFILGLTVLSTNSIGQTKDSVSTDETIFADPLVYPTFPGGQNGLTEYIKKNFNWTQGQLTVEGKVFVEFVVDIDGKIKDAKIARGLCESCDKEALRLVNNMPTWIAGTENGKKVKTKMVLPIMFGL
jgi:protein TonB